jgi:tetratricopeptide (TPR) repeat protein
MSVTIPTLPENNPMNEQRLQAYLNLIQQLLDCLDGEEANVLQAKPDLLDSGLVAVAKEETARLEKQRNFKGAERLLTLCKLLEYRAFLQEILQAEYQSNGNLQIITPILQQNQDKLDLGFLQIFQDWADSALSQANPEETQVIVAVIGDFSHHIAQFPQGERADNLEIAIRGYEIALRVYTREAFPEQWATVQHNLGTAYSNRLRGERQENLERAIAAYKAALEVLTREAFPVDWASTQNNLAVAYFLRIRGDKAENLEQAIAAYEKAFSKLLSG